MDKNDLISVISFLYSILDDIDTISDLARDNNILYRDLVNIWQGKKNLTGIISDGYSLNFDKMVVPKICENELRDLFFQNLCELKG